MCSRIVYARPLLYQYGCEDAGVELQCCAELTLPLPVPVKASMIAALLLTEVSLTVRKGSARWVVNFTKTLNTLKSTLERVILFDENDVGLNELEV